MEKIRIVGILVPDRLKEANEIQAILTEFGCNIKTRLGLHEVSDISCSKNGLIILELKGAEEEKDRLLSKLEKVPGITVKTMDF